MKKVILVRHGKSSWSDPYLSDDQRPLKKRGRKDAITIAKLFRKQELKIDQIYTSHAKRAAETAFIFKEVLGIEKFSEHRSLYHAGELEILRFINKIDDGHQFVMLFGHNPSYTGLLNYFSEARVDNVPTSGAYQINFDTDSWHKISVDNGKLYDYWFPRAYR